nr:MAG TPA: PlyB like endolysin [Caudoviricetes sp.]
MEIKGIDVSSYQKKPDWKKVKQSGVKFAILRIHQRSGIDTSFEHNYKGCCDNGILVGGYKLSYATTVAEAEKEAEETLSVLKGRKLDFPIFYDLEWETQRKFSKSKLEAIALAFLRKIHSAGYKVGIYSNVDWFNNLFTPAMRDYDCWIARYPANDNGKVVERLRPAQGIGWQHSSKGKVPGIDGNVDMDVFYKDYSDTQVKGDVSEMTKTEAINKVLSVAKAEIGYLEKKSNSQLNSKTANAGSGNYTKYWRDVKPSYQGQPWCACFVSWCFMKAFGQDKAKKLLRHWPYVYCPTLGNLFVKNANPKVGDIVIFYHGGRFTHTGIVTLVNGDEFSTIEGNTSGASGIIPNGGGVCAKSYLNSKLPGTKFCTPDWSIVADTSTNNSSNTADTTENSKLSKTPKFVGKVTANSLNVRTWAGTENPQLRSYPTLAKGNLIDVCDTVKAKDGSSWYYIRIAGKYFGFASAKYIEKV